MKVVFDCPQPVAFAHGGAQIQVDQTKAGLEACGVEVEYLRWWDSSQRFDLVHFFGVPSTQYLSNARVVGKPVVITNLFTETCNRSPARWQRQRWLMQALLALPFGRSVKRQLNWTAFGLATHNVVGLTAEKNVLTQVYRVPADKISVVPLGLSPTFLSAGPGSHKESHLICTGTITPRKCSVELATLARAAQVPILFVGKPYHESDVYWRQFRNLIDGRWVRHQPHTDSEAEMVALLQAARGFVLMSWYENWCLSAHEAVACGLPLLVPDQNWSRERFGDRVKYFPGLGVNDTNLRVLKSFYEEAPRLAAPAIKLHDWRAVASELKKVYEMVLARPA